MNNNLIVECNILDVSFENINSNNFQKQLLSDIQEVITLQYHTTYKGKFEVTLSQIQEFVMALFTLNTATYGSEKEGTWLMLVQVGCLLHLPVYIANTNHKSGM